VQEKEDVPEVASERSEKAAKTSMMSVQKESGRSRRKRDEACRTETRRELGPRMTFKPPFLPSSPANYGIRVSWRGRLNFRDAAGVGAQSVLLP
jgi:hypothetical protein